VCVLSACSAFFKSLPRARAKWGGRWGGRFSQTSDAPTTHNSLVKPPRLALGIGLGLLYLKLRLFTFHSK
jgi:hypothetical protein